MGHYRHIENTACSFVCFLKCHGSTGEKSRLHSSELSVSLTTDLQTFFAHLDWILRDKWMTKELQTYVVLSNRAPVLKNRSMYTEKGSSHAVILSASLGSSKTSSSSSVLVQARAATRPPALVPLMTRGSNPSSKNAFITPKWSARTTVNGDHTDGILIRTHSSPEYPLRIDRAQWYLHQHVNSRQLHFVQENSPRLVFVLLKNCFFSSNDISEVSRMNSKDRSNSSKYARGASKKDQR